MKKKYIFNLALVQYYLSQGEHKLKVAPHGNSRGDEPYVRMMPSLMFKRNQRRAHQSVYSSLLAMRLVAL